MKFAIKLLDEGFNELESYSNTAHGGFIFLTSLNPAVTLLVISSHAPSIIMPIEMHAPPSFIAFNSVVGMKVYLRDP